MISENEIDIHSGFPYPSGALSNFCHYPFTFHGETIESTEGFLQGIKCKSIDEQRKLFSMHGFEAKKAGSKHRVTNGIYYFQGKPYHRLSNGYLRLVSSAYFQMATQNPDYCKALLATGDKILRHTCGGHEAMKTVLTEREFCFILTVLRNMLQGKHNDY